MHLSLRIFALWACLILPALTKFCKLPETFGPPGYGAFYFTSQQQADEALKGCTTVDGRFEFAPEYVGSFVQSGVTNITKGISIYADHHDYYPHQVTSMVWNDLESSELLSFYNASSLVSISFPKLTRVERLGIISFKEPVEVDLPSLVSTEQFSIQGNIASVNAPLLFNASKVTLGDFTLPLEVDAFVGYDLSLPSLELAQGIRLSGLFKSISLPQLKSVSAAGSNYDLTIYPTLPLNISLPSLTTVNSPLLFIYGDQSISVPLLRTARKIIFDATNNTKFVFPALESATSIKLSGAVLDASFPKISNVDSISIIGNGRIRTNCATALEEWRALNSTWDNDCTYGKSCRTFECEWSGWKYPSPKKTLSIGEIAGVVCGGCAFALVIIFGSNWRHKQKKKQVSVQREIELDGVTIMGDAEREERVVAAVAEDARRDSKETIVVGVNQAGENGQRS